MNSMNSAGCLVVVVGALLAGACQGGSQPAGPSPVTSPPAAEVDVGGTGDPSVPGTISVGPEQRASLVRHAVLAFRAEGSSFVGGYRTHEAAISDGIVQVAPYTYPDGERRSHLAMALETTAITADGVAIAGGVTSTALADGGVVVTRDGVEEHLRNEEDGLHQEWRFAAAPGDGDLVVDVAVSGYRYTQSTEGGLHFVSNDGAGLRYSHALWVDHDGAAWPIEAVYDAAGGRIRMTVPASVIDRTTFPAVLDPTVTAEVAVDTPVVGPTGANQQHPAIAFNGTNYLVVWDDNRDSTDSDIWGTRLSAAGAVLDSLGIKIAAGTGAQSNPTVAWNGSTFVVAWEDFKVSRGTDSDIGAATVSSAGVVAQLGRIATTATSETKPQLAGRTDGRALVVWNAAGTLRGSVFTTTTFGAAFDVATGAVSGERAGVAANPAGNFLVSYSASTDLKGQFVTSAGALSGAAFNISAGAGTQSASAAAFTGTDFAVVWANNNAGISVFGARVSTAGAVLDTHLESAVAIGGIQVSAAPSPGSPSLPTIGCNASGCLVTWQDRRNLATTNFDVFGRLLSASFVPGAADVAITTATERQVVPAVGASSTGFLAAWQDLRDTSAFGVFASTVSTAGALGTAARIGTGNNRETAPGMGRAGTLTGLFWSDSRAQGNDIRFTRFNGSGSKLDATALAASTATLAQLEPSASADLGTNTFVVWSDARSGTSRDVFGARVTLSTGAVVDTNGIALSAATADQLGPTVASNGSLALVVWADRRGGTFDVRGTIVNSAGVVTVPDFDISSAASDQTHPSVTWDAASGQFLVVWADQRAGSIVHIFGTRVSTAGAVLDAAGVSIGSAANGQFAPVIASTATGTLAVWQDRRDAPAGGYNIWGSRLKGGTTLQVLDPTGIKISNRTTLAAEPAIAGVGTGYIVVWSDNRVGQNDVFGQQVNSNGTLASTEFTVSNTTADESAPSLLWLGGSSTTVRVAYESHKLGTSRIATRLISAQLGGGSACTNAATCSTGFCVDGFCCDSACGGNHVPPGSTTAGDCHGCAARYTNQADGVCAPLPSTSICRGYRNTFCDNREYCDGVSTTCGADLGRNQGLACSKTLNVPAGTGTGVCPSNGAPGPHLCQ